MTAGAAGWIARLKAGGCGEGEGRPRLIDRVAAWPPALLVGLAIAAFVALSIVPLMDDSCVNDEIAHLPAGYTYWKKRDFRLNPEHPPLVKLLAGLPLQFLPVRWPEEPRFWETGEEWNFGYRLLYHAGNDADRLVFWGRLPMLAWGIVLLVSIYGVTRNIFGPRGALVSLTLATFCPEFLAHGHLVNTDAAIAATMFLAVCCFWKFGARPSPVWALASGLSLGTALAVKFSAVMLVPALLWYLGVVFTARARSEAPSAASAWVKPALLMFVIAAVSFATIWASYGFRYRASPDPTFEFPWKPVEEGASAIARSIAFARTYRLLPESYLYGFSYFHEQSQARNAFALGQFSTEGWGWYFPFAFLVKTPVAHLVLYGWGLYWCWRRINRGDLRDQFLIIPLIIYWILAIMSRMNIGVRHIIPVLPLMIVLAGGIEYEDVARSVGRWQARIAAGLLAAAALEVGLAAPYFLAFFNAPACLRYERHEMLVDSNLDWGQDLKRLKRYVDRNGGASLKLGYFGNASPAQLRLNHEQLPGSNMYRQVELDYPAAEELRPGDLVAISATNYVGLLIPEPEFYRSRFGNRKPDATIGHSILIFKMPPR